MGLSKFLKGQPRKPWGLKWRSSVWFITIGASFYLSDLILLNLQISRRFRFVISLSSPSSVLPLFRYHHRSPRLLYHHPRHALPTRTSQIQLRLRSHRLASLCIRTSTLPSSHSSSHNPKSPLGWSFVCPPPSPISSPPLTIRQPQYPSQSTRKRVPPGVLPSSWVSLLS